MKKKTITNMDLLPSAFCDAVQNGTYPPNHEGVLAFNIEDHASLIEGKSYAQSLYNNDWKFYVNILAIKDMAYLSFHPSVKPERIDAVIEYNPTRQREGRKICDMAYYSRRVEKDTTFYQVLQKLRLEFFNVLGVELFEKPKIGGKISYLKLIKMIICCAKWKELMESDPNLPPEENAIRIASIALLELEPVTVASYALFSSDHEVCAKATRAYSILREKLQDITGKWSDLIDKEPDLTPVERAEKLSLLEGMNLTPTTIAGYAKVSPGPRVRKEGHIAYTYLLMKEHDITNKWRELIESQPDLSPAERAITIGSELNLSSLTIAAYGRASSDPAVKSEATVAYKVLYEKKLDVTGRWLKIKRKKPELTPIEIATQIGKELSLSPISIAGYGRASSDPIVKSETHVACNTLSEKRLDVTGRWLKIKRKKLELTPIEIATQIGKELSLSPITIAAYGRSSSAKIVKSESIKAYKALRRKSREQTDKIYI